MLVFLESFSDQVQLFNLFGYLTFRTGGAILTAMAVVFLFGPRLIKSFRIRQGKGQPIREDGPRSHLDKAGTPTMGGVMILLGLTVSVLLWADWSNGFVWAVLAVTLGFGMVGFYDDYLKVSKQSHKGFSGKQRLGIEIFIAGCAVYAIAMLSAPDTAFSVAAALLQGPAD
jgi:phospho-N-acetylmuramoyl-pentapeptide-transferase